MMFAYLIGMVGNVKSEAIEEMLEDYKEELYQLRYNSKYKSARKQRFSERVQQAAYDAKMLSDVAKMESQGTDK